MHRTPIRICWFILNKCGSLFLKVHSWFYRNNYAGVLFLVSPTLHDGYVLNPFYDVILCILSNLTFISLKYIAYIVLAYLACDYVCLCSCASIHVTSLAVLT